MEDITRAEKRVADDVEREYRDKGYVVQREVPLDFLDGLRVDMVARKDGETVAIDVMTATSLARIGGKRREKIYKTINAQKGWSHTLVLAGEPERLSSRKDATPFNLEDALIRIGEAERCLEAGFPEAAVLLAWSALEAVIRIVMREDGFEIKRITNSSYTIEHALEWETISYDDYDSLIELVKYRNAIIHGFSVDEMDGERLTREIIALANEIWGEFVMDV